MALPPSPPLPRPSLKPCFQPMKYEFFQPQDFIPAEILTRIKDPFEAKNLGFFFYERKEEIVGVTIDGGSLTKVFTKTQDNVKRIWAKKMGQPTQFCLWAEIKPPPIPKTAPPKSMFSIDEVD